MRKLRALKPGDLGSIIKASELMKDARALLRMAGANKSANATARALKSVDGAVRHASRVDFVQSTRGGAAQ